MAINADELYSELISGSSELKMLSLLFSYSFVLTSE
jgi:hypothetical protein